MTRFKFKKGTEKISEEEIKETKDFNKVLRSYNKAYSYKAGVRPLYKDQKFLSFIILLVIILLTIIISETENKKDKQKKDTEVVSDTAQIEKPSP